MSWFQDFVSENGQVDFKELQRFVNQENISFEDFEKEFSNPLLIGREVYMGELNIPQQQKLEENLNDTSTVKFNANLKDADKPMPTKRIIPNVEKALTPEQHVYAIQLQDSQDYQDSSEAVIGKSRQCGLTITDPSVSRQHARIVFSNNCYFVQDLNSTNGTKVSFQNVKSDELKPLLPNMKISFGRLVYIFTPVRLFYSSLVLN